MNVCIKRSMAHALSVLMIASALIAGLTAFGTAERVYAEPAITFTHPGGYELTLEEVDTTTPPAPVDGDYITVGDKVYSYSFMGGIQFLYNGSPDPYESFDYEWIDLPNPVVEGTYHFRYKMYNYILEADEYTEPIEVTVKAEAQTPTMEYVLKDGSKTVSREMISAMGNNAIPEEEKGDQLTITIGSDSTTYTHDGMEFMHNSDALYDLIGNTLGREWDEDEDFTGDTATYHFYATINGTRVVSNDLTVTLTGDPTPTKTMKAIAFTPVDVYEVEEGDTDAPPLPVNGDKITVTYSDNTTEDFTYSENGGASGADFYNENGKSLSQLATDDWERVWSPGATFNVGDEPTFYYTLGDLKSGDTGKAKIVGKPEPPAEKKVTAIEFQHDGKYEMSVEGDPSDPDFTPPATPEPIEGDKIIVTYEDETTETFVYDVNGLWTSETTSDDLEDKGVLIRSWNADQKFSPDGTAYFRYSLTVGDDVLETSDIPVKITGEKPEPKPTPTPTPVQARYTLTFDLNGGEWDGATGIVKWEGIVEGAIIEMPTPKRAGYKFEYWEGSKYYAGQEYTVTEDHTFKAVWTADNGTSGGSSGKGKGVNTGDPNDIAGLLALMLASMVALGAEAVMRWRRSES